MAIITDIKLATAKIEANAPMHTEDIIKQIVREWLTSDAKKLMDTGDQYYLVKNDILDSPRMAIGPNGSPTPAENVADTRLAHAFLRELVDQKVQYLLGKNYTVSSDDESYTEQLDSELGDDFADTLKSIATDAINMGLGWIYPYIDENGLFKIKRVDPREVIPLWKDEAHTELGELIHVFDIEGYEGGKSVTTTYIDYWGAGFLKHYILDGEIIREDEEGRPAPLNVENQRSTWDKIPFIPVKYNDREQPLIDTIKTLVDDYDRIASNDSNTLLDQPNSILVLRNYDGANLGKFRMNLNAFRAVKVSDEGGVEQLTSPVSVESSNKHLERLRRDIYAFGRGVDTRSEKLTGAVSGVALKQEYVQLDLDVNGLERGIKRALKQMLFFVNTKLQTLGKTAEFIFNRDVINVEAEAIEMCKNSVGIISEQTIIENHPWVSDVEEELARINAEKEENIQLSGGDYPYLTADREGAIDGEETQTKD